MSERVRRLGAVLGGVPALLLLLDFLWLIWSAVTGTWQTVFFTNGPDVPWALALFTLLALALLVSALACAWCAAQWWRGRTRRASVGSLMCLAAGMLLFPVTGGASLLLMLPSLTLLYWRRTNRK